MMGSTDLAIKTWPLYLNGEMLSGGEAAEIRSPFDDTLVGRVAYGTAEHVEEAIQAAVRAFEVTRKLPVYERQRILSDTAQALANQREEFAQTLALESGKPIKIARFEVDRSVFTLRIAAEEASRISGEVLSLDLLPFAKNRWGIIRRFPVGPVTAIAAFNFPLILAAHKIAPAIAAGCSVVLKPPPQDPISSLMLAGLFQHAGAPAGSINVLPLANQHALKLVTDPRMRLVTFTGSTNVGWELRQQAGRKRVLLELGGNAAAIVHHDADLTYAAERCASGAFTFAGQSCVSVQRIFVHQEIQEAFTELLVQKTRQLKLGDPLDESTDVGPLISERDAIRASGWIAEAVKSGARVLSGGNRKGSLLEPTLLTNTNREMRVNCQEIFAPVATLEAYSNFDEVLQLVNDSQFGLQTGLFTNQANLIFRAYEELKVGGLIAGDIPTWRIDHMPYGGVRDSGIGREGLRFAIEEMTERKLLVMNQIL